MSFLPGQFPALQLAAAAAAAASVSYVGTAEITTNGTGFSFAALGIGAAAAGRKVVVGVMSTTLLTTMTATLNGVSMTQLAINAYGGAFFAIDEASLTSTTVAFTSGVTLSNLRVWVWDVFNGAATPYDTQVDTTLTSGHNDITLNCPAGSVAMAIAIYKDQTANGPTTTWSGVTERADNSITDQANTACASAADGTFAAATSAAIQSTYTVVLEAFDSLYAISL